MKLLRLRASLTQDFEDLFQLVELERVGGALVLNPLKERLEGQQLRKDASNGPDVDSWRVVLGTEKEVGGAVPDCHHNLRRFDGSFSNVANVLDRLDQKASVRLQRCARC
jgi:hypothetical protein